MADRIKLQITKVNPTQKVGEKQIPKLTFEAKSPDGKELPYFIFGNTTLFDMIKVGSEVDAEVETKGRIVSGNTFIDRRVTQIFVEGKPIAEKKQWQPRSDNPEQRRSIERQVAAKLAMEFSIGPDLQDKLADAERIYQWISGGKLPLKEGLSPSLKTSSPLTESSDIISKEGELPLGFDAAWLMESLKKIKWTENTIKSYLMNKFKVETTGTVVEVVARLTKEDRTAFFQEVQNQLDKREQNK